MQSTDTKTGMKYSKLAITGCDSTTEWMLHWFILNFTKHNNIPLMVFDFGMTPSLTFDYPRVPMISEERGWFKKPKAMQKALQYADQVVWLDTDCHVKGDISPIFDFIVPNKLAMAEDQPWTMRMKQIWHNTGVVGFSGPSNTVLDQWIEAVTKDPKLPASGDQQILHTLLNQGLNRLTMVNTIPKTYNCLRLDVVDGTAVPKPVIMHWTGQIGKQKIKDIMNGPNGSCNW